METMWLSVIIWKSSRRTLVQSGQLGVRSCRVLARMLPPSASINIYSASRVRHYSQQHLDSVCPDIQWSSTSFIPESKPRIPTNAFISVSCNISCISSDLLAIFQLQARRPPVLWSYSHPLAPLSWSSLGQAPATEPPVLPRLRPYGIDAPMAGNYPYDLSSGL